MRRHFSVIFISVAVFVFLLGLGHLLLLRFEAGDVYPAYSSLRADPLGTMVLYESLERLPGIKVERDYSRNNRLPNPPGCAYLQLGARPAQWRLLDANTVSEVEGFLLRGGRLIVAFLPYSTSAGEEALPSPEAVPAKSSKKKAPGAKKAAPEGEDSLRPVDVQARWQFGLVVLPLNTPAGQPPQPARVLKRSDLPLPENLEWHSGLILTNLGSSWKTLYARGRHPVLAERKLGAGTLVLATDCYFCSNEGLRLARQPALVTWLIGDAERVVFDEAHFGITETEGVAALVRRYRLVGLLLVLVLLAVLFIWKNSFSFIPAPQNEDPTEVLTGKDAASGFVNLLRRNISPDQVVPEAWKEWKRSAPLQRNLHLARRVSEAEALFSSEKPDRDPLSLYQSLHRKLFPPKSES